MSDEAFSATLSLQAGYRYLVSFDQEGLPDLVVDEPPPLGEGAGPNAARLLAAAVGSCMSASLRYCLDRAHIEVVDIRTRVEGTLQRDDRGRLRVGGLRVRIEPRVGLEQAQRIGRCLEIFEDFCTVGASVRKGIPLQVDVRPEVVEGSPSPAR